MVGEQVAQQYIGVKKGLTPKGVHTIICTNIKAQISYYKAWRWRQYVQSLIGGSPKEIFYMLHLYCYMLKKVNPMTVTCIQVDEESRFKYFFLGIWGCN